jgi:hypothetical protein
MPMSTVLLSREKQLEIKLRLARAGLQYALDVLQNLTGVNRDGTENDRVARVRQALEDSK